MDPRKLFYDDRLKVCVHCGSASEDSDHVPSKVLLDEPYPPNLPVVSSCRSCNNSFSADEPYVACMVDCAKSDSQDGCAQRDRVLRLMDEHPGLGREVEALRSTGVLTRVICDLENPRLTNVILKLARGHVAYECGELALCPPRLLSLALLEEMTRSERDVFEEEPEPSIFPELGSRAFLAMVAAADGTVVATPGWNTVQTGRYRYMVCYEDELTVRMVLSEYLACVVAW